MFNKIKKIVKNTIKSLDILTVGLGLLLMSGLIITEVKSIQKDRAYEKQVAAMELAHAAEVSQLEATNAVLEAKLNKTQKLNKALLAQLDTKSEQIADVKTYITNTSKTICSDTAEVIAENVVNQAIKYNVPVATIVSVMEVESHFNFQAVGGVGERGLMQVRFNVWSKKLAIKSKYDLHNITIGVEKGVQVLDISLKECKYDLKRAIRQYNSGSTSRGSQTYVSNVMKAMSEYAAHVSLRQVIKDKQKKEAEEVPKDESKDTRITPGVN